MGSMLRDLQCVFVCARTRMFLGVENYVGRPPPERGRQERAQTSALPDTARARLRSEPVTFFQVKKWNSELTTLLCVGVNNFVQVSIRDCFFSSLGVCMKVKKVNRIYSVGARALPKYWKSWKHGHVPR